MTGSVKPVEVTLTAEPIFNLERARQLLGELRNGTPYSYDPHKTTEYRDQIERIHVEE